jgi:hypothetical protein
MTFTQFKKLVADGGEIELIRAEYTNEEGRRLKDDHDGLRVKGYKTKVSGKASDWTITDRHATFDDGQTLLVYYIGKLAE